MISCCDTLLVDIAWSGKDEIFNSTVPEGRKTSGTTFPESAWTDDCKHRGADMKTSNHNGHPEDKTSGHVRKHVFHQIFDVCGLIRLLCILQ